MSNKLIVKDIFLDLKIVKQVRISDRIIDIPAKYTGNAIMGIFTIATKEAKRILATSIFSPVEIYYGRSLLGVTIFNYLDSPVGPYNELALSIPSLVNSKFSIPLFPLLLRNILKNFGFFTIFLAMNKEVAKEHGEKVFGYPHYEDKIEICFLYYLVLLNFTISHGFSTLN